MDAFWIILTGAIVAINCTLIGSFLVLRKTAMVGDALSHSVLPGMVLAYVILGNKNLIGILTASILSGFVLVLLIDFLQRSRNIREDAAIGLSYTALFSLGVILVSLFADQVHLDQEHVLYGEIAYLPLDVIFWGDSILGPRSFYISAGLLLVLTLFISRMYKGLMVTSFDPDFAESVGIKTRVWNYVLMALVSLTVVVSFENVGAILVVAFLITPAATAYLLTNRMGPLIAMSLLFAAVSSVGGYVLALVFDSSISGSMALFCGLMFLVVLTIQRIRRA